MLRAFDGWPRRVFGRGSLIVLGCLVGVAVAGGVAFATIPDANGVVHLCYRDNGNVRVIDTGAAKQSDGSCANNETELDIDQHGTPGPVGPPGPAGPAGPKGDTGAPGPEGDTGPTGAPGPKGDTGATGAPGPKGDTGATGAPGPKGDAGAPGPKGDTGAPGAPGPKGEMGPAGQQGPQGVPGPPGAKGDTGARGDTGPQGAQGPQGVQGATGATGPQGTQGPKGDTGPQGPPAAVSVGTRRGMSQLPTATLAFLSPPLPVTVSAGQVVLVSAQATFGTTDAAGAFGLRLWICYQPTGGTVIAEHGGDWVQVATVQNTTLPFPLTDTITGLGTGTYNVGLCGSVAGTNNWNVADWAYTTAQVIGGASLITSAASESKASRPD